MYKYLVCVCLILGVSCGPKPTSTPTAKPLPPEPVRNHVLLSPKASFLTGSISVTSFGATGNGSTDDTTAINAALAAYSTVYFPPPTTCYKTTSALQLHSNQQVIGLGQGAGICAYSTTADALFASFASSGTRNIVIANMFLNDEVTSTRTTGASIHIDGSTDAAIIDIHDNSSVGFQDGLWISSTINSSIANNRWTSAKRDGVYQTLASTSTGFYNNYADAPVQYCYYITALTYSTFDSNACDSAGSDGYHFDASSTPIRGITLNSSGVEQPTGNGYYLDGQGFTINGPAITSVPTGTGMAAIKINGAGNVSISDTYLNGGDYAINLATTPGHGAQANSVSLSNVYAESYAISEFNDPNGLLSVIPAFGTSATGTQPTCSSTLRGNYWFALGGSGVADHLSVCAKGSGGSYSWVTVF